MIYKVAVSWEVCGEVEVEANSLEEALNRAENDESIDLPIDAHYIDASWQVDREMSEFLNQNNG